MPAASVGRREEERRPASCSELPGDCTELHGCSSEQEQHRGGSAMLAWLCRQVLITVEVKNRPRTTLLPSTRVTAALGDSYEKPWAASGLEDSNNKTTGQTKSKPDAEERTEEGLVRKLSAVSDQRLQVRAEAGAPCGFSKCTTMRRRIYGSETLNVVQNNEVKIKP